MNTWLIRARRRLSFAKVTTAGKTALAALNGVTFRVASTAAGGTAGGNAKSIAHTANTGVYTVDLGQDVSACEYAATLGGVKTSGSHSRARRRGGHVGPGLRSRPVAARLAALARLSAGGGYDWRRDAGP